METVEKMGMQERRQIHNKHNEHKRELTILALLAAAVLALAFCCLFAGSSHMSFGDCLNALLGKSTAANNRILWNIRIPRVLAALIAGAGLSVSGLIMQTNLNNPMASPSTLGVSNAAVFGANLSIIAFSGGFLSAGNNPANYGTGANPYSTSLMAFGFSLLSILLILALCRLRAFSPGVVVLAGIAVGSVWTAATTVLQFYATDVGLSAAVIWNFGDLGRATYRTDLLMLAAVVCGLVFFQLMSWKYNALLGGDGAAQVRVKRGAFVWNNDGSIKDTDVLKPCYAKNGTTVTIMADGASVAGVILAVEPDGVTVDMTAQPVIRSYAGGSAENE